VKRAKQAHNFELAVDPKVYDAIADRCREVESGARNVDHILRGTVMPLVSQEILKRIASEEPMTGLKLSLDAEGAIVCTEGGG